MTSTNGQQDTRATREERAGSHQGKEGERDPLRKGKRGISIKGKQKSHIPPLFLPPSPPNKHSLSFPPSNGELRRHTPFGGGEERDGRGRFLSRSRARTFLPLFSSPPPPSSCTCTFFFFFVLPPPPPKCFLDVSWQLRSVTRTDHPRRAKKKQKSVTLAPVSNKRGAKNCATYRTVQWSLREKFFE